MNTLCQISSTGYGQSCLVKYWVLAQDRKGDVRVPGKGNSNSYDTRPVHLIITMRKWIRTSRLSIKNSLSLLPSNHARSLKLCHAPPWIPGERRPRQLFQWLTLPPNQPLSTATNDEIVVSYQRKITHACFTITIMAQLCGCFFARSYFVHSAMQYRGVFQEVPRLIFDEMYFSLALCPHVSPSYLN